MSDRQPNNPEPEPTEFHVILEGHDPTRPIRLPFRLRYRPKPLGADTAGAILPAVRSKLANESDEADEPVFVHNPEVREP